MASATRTQRAAKLAADYTHVTTVLLGENPADGLLTALNEDGITTVPDLLNLSTVDIDGLAYDDGHGTQVDVLKAKRNLIKVFKAYASEQNWIKDRLVDFQDLDANDFDEYRAARYDPNATVEPWVTRVNRANASAARGGAGSGAQGGSGQGGRAQTPKDAFLRNIKRDSSRYSNFKDEKQWDTWNRGFRATIRSQQLENILDENYSSANVEQQDLFKAQNTFVYTILVEHLLTDFGKSLVRTHEANDFNAQEIYAELRKRMEASTIGTIKATELLAQITGARMKDARWNGTKEGYVIAWRDKIRHYDSLVEPAMVISEPLKLVLHKNLVEGIPDRENLKTQD